MPHGVPMGVRCREAWGEAVLWGGSAGVWLDCLAGVAAEQQELAVMGAVHALQWDITWQLCHNFVCSSSKHQAILTYPYPCSPRGFPPPRPPQGGLGLGRPSGNRDKDKLKYPYPCSLRGAPPPSLPEGVWGVGTLPGNRDRDMQ